MEDRYRGLVPFTASSARDVANRRWTREWPTRVEKRVNELTEWIGTKPLTPDAYDALAELLRNNAPERKGEVAE